MFVLSSVLWADSLDSPPPTEELHFSWGLTEKRECAGQRVDHRNEYSVHLCDQELQSRSHSARRRRCSLVPSITEARDKSHRTRAEPGSNRPDPGVVGRLDFENVEKRTCSL